MNCPQCGTENQAGFKFCVKCGSNLEKSQEKSQDIDIEKVGMSGYHSEDEPQSGGFKLSGGTFTINDNPPESSSSDFYSSDELNDTDEEFDFSGFDFDEPFIPKLDTGRVALPEKTVRSQANAFAQSAGSMFDDPIGTPPPPPPKTLGSMFDEPTGTLPPPKTIGDYSDDYEDDEVPPPVSAAPPQNAVNGMPNQSIGAIPQPQAMGGMAAQTIGGMPVQTMGGMPTQTMGAQTMGGMPVQTMGGMPTQTMGAQTMGGMPNQAMGANLQPQIIGYDQSGMPIYGQPQMMFAQPQIIGYDQNGMPVYGQPQMMFAQPQIIGYDQSGMPVYGQPQMIFAQPQIIGYDQNGMPVYAQVQPMMNQQAMGGMPTPAKAEPEPQMPVEDDEKVEVPDNFWEFFDGGKATEHAEPADDFFGQRSSDMGGFSSSDFDHGRLKKAERKKNSYMSDTPLVDAAKLAKREDAKYNKLYMKNTETVNAADLQAKKTEAPQDFMGHTRDVDASDLKAYKRGKAWSMMGNTKEADANDLEAFVPKHNESLMGQADHAVESMPRKKVRTYNDEIDSIELPDYMKARKTVKKDSPEIPGLPEL